ncbi:MAG: hypothetical protein HW380_2682 [Magnetococcales bacterium]|nr:hypothetical protein [Magnetococcales bacterium]HIJ84245.1 hypothetical protein [Magnetococcales bacterium]
MQNFTLNINFTSSDIQLFYQTGTNLIIAKAIKGDANTPSAVWQVIRPMEANSVTWTEQYGIYASKNQIDAGTAVTKMASTGIPAVPGRIYDLTPAGTLAIQSQGNDANAFTVVNDYQTATQMMTIGLYQAANVNGIDVTGNVTSAAAVIYKFKAVITPINTVYMWLQSSTKGNSTLKGVFSPMTVVPFSDVVTIISMQYDPQTALFFSAGSNAPTQTSSLNTRPEIRHIAPRM